ncbi:MAG: FAD-dependent oxidoreductase [Oscillospiraceae bacterium]|nr:FAD-dependent oxidoreductase [Oscillospiraceae bacterium]
MADQFDVIIIGGGAAACSAALTLRNRGKTVGVVANRTETSSLYKAEMVTNYPGLPPMSGAELSALFRRQLEESGAELIPGRALSVLPMGDSFGVAVGNEFYLCKALIVAAGITREKLYPGEGDYLGRGVSYCATCDGMLYRGKTVAVVGGGEEARHDAAFLESIGCRVLRFEQNGRYEIRGGMKADTLVYNGEEHRVDCVFIIKDTVSVTKLVPGLEYRDGAIVVDRRMATSVPGVFAAGDCTGKPFQLAKAVGEGNVAALSAVDHIATLQGRAAL